MIAEHGLPIVALMVFVAELGLPTGMSPKVALLVAGSVAVGSWPELVAALALMTIANLLGTVALHGTARRGGAYLGPRLARRNRAMNGAALERWRARLGGCDAAAVFVGRIVPVARVYVTVAAGLLRLRWRDFVLGAAPAALVWSGTPLVIGYIFRANVQEFSASSSFISRAFFIAVPLVGVIAAAGWWVRRGPSTRNRLQRGRVVIGGALAAGIAIWHVAGAGANATLAVSLTPLAAMLVGLALADVLALSGRGPRSMSRALAGGLGMACWLVGFGALAATIAGSQLG